MKKASLPPKVTAEDLKKMSMRKAMGYKNGKQVKSNAKAK